MSYGDEHEDSGRSFGNRIVAALPRFVMQVGGVAVATLIGFTIYIYFSGGFWQVLAFLTVVIGIVAAGVYKFVRKMSGDPVRFSGTDDPYEAEIESESARGMDISENKVLLRFSEEFNAAMSDLDEFGICEIRTSFLTEHKVKQEELSKIIESIIFDDFEKIVKILVKRTSNMKLLKFYDPVWEAAGHYSGKTFGSSDESDEGTAAESE